MRYARRIADWVRHARRRDIALTLLVVGACVSAVLAAAAGNSTRHAGAAPAAAAAQPPTTTDETLDLDRITGTGEAATKAKKRHKAKKSKHKKSRHKHHAKGKKAHSHAERVSAKRHADRSGHGTAGVPAAFDDDVVIGSDVGGRDAINRFFKQYSVNAAAADGTPAMRAVAAWVNSHGGIAGHKVTLRERTFDFYGSPVSVQDEATCSTWSSGARPLVDIDSHASTDILIPCLRKHGIGTFVNTTTPPASTDFAAAGGWLFSPGSPALDRAQTAYVRGLKDAGFFAGKSKVGLLLSTNLPQLGSGAEALKRALKAAGVGVDATGTISLEDPASFFASEASAVLKFRLAKVDHIIALDQDGLALGQFMRGAEAEEYRPVYGVSSFDAPAFLAAGSSAKQLHRAIGVGWSPLLDVQASDDPGGGSTRATCASIFSGAGVSVGGRTPFGQFAVYQACDSLLALKAAGAHSPTTLVNGMNALGSRFQSAMNLGTYLSPGQHDGTAAWRLLRYIDGCHCFRYDGGNHPM